MNRNLAQRSRETLYSLKRQYGDRIDIYKLLSSSTNELTGVKVINKDCYPIQRAVVMPERKDRTVQQSISLISANKEFVQGGTYDVGTRDFIVERRDSPNLPDLGADDWIVYAGFKYQIKTVELFEPNAGWVITAKRLSGEVPEQIYLRKPDPTLLNMTSVASATV